MISNFHWIVTENTMGPLNINASLRHVTFETYPLYVLYGGLIIELWDNKQYLPIAMTTACPPPVRRRSPRMTQSV